RDGARLRPGRDHGSRPRARQRADPGGDFPDPGDPGAAAVLALYLLVTVLFSYYATLGATVLAGTVWSGRPLEQVDWRVPFFLFTILVAVGEDYNILLVTRAVQERRRHGAVEGMRRALARTGGAITSCGLIMAGT